MNKMWKMDRMLLTSSLICLIPLALSAVFYTRLPETVAVQWGSGGQVTNTSPRWFAAFGMPLILLIVNVVVHVTMNNDPKRENGSRVLRGLGKWLVPAVAVLSNAMILVSALAGPINPALFGSVLMGVVLVAVGNYLPKCRQNYTIGIKLPWTLHSADNWNRTHRAAGYAYIAGGLLMLATAFLPVGWLSPVLLVSLVGFPFVYSFILYKRGI